MKKPINSSFKAALSALAELHEKSRDYKPGFIEEEIKKAREWEFYRTNAPAKKVRSWLLSISLSVFVITFGIMAFTSIGSTDLLNFFFGGLALLLAALVAHHLFQRRLSSFKTFSVEVMRDFDIGVDLLKIAHNKILPPFSEKALEENIVKTARKLTFQIKRGEVNDWRKLQNGATAVEVVQLRDVIVPLIVHLELMGVDKICGLVDDWKVDSLYETRVQWVYQILFQQVS